MLIPIVLGVLLRGEPWNRSKAGSLLLAVLALVLLSADFSSSVHFDLFEGYQAAYFVLCVGAWGVQVFLMGSLGGAGNHTLTLLFMGLGLALGVAVCSGAVFRDVHFVNSDAFFLSLAAGAALGLTHLTYFMVLKHMVNVDVGVFNSICALYIVWGVVLGLLPPLEESVSPNKIVGLLCAVLAAVALSRPDFWSVVARAVRRLAACCCGCCGIRRRPTATEDDLAPKPELQLQQATAVVIGDPDTVPEASNARVVPILVLSV